MGIKPFEELTFTDDFIFGKVMSDETICRMFLQTILKLQIGEIHFLNDQEKIKNYFDTRAVVLDIYLEDEKQSINIEMQNVNRYDLPERTRYYQSMMDARNQPKGRKYRAMKSNYVIFICTFDATGLKLPLVHLSTHCDEDPNYIWPDRGYKILLDTTNIQNTLDEDLKAFYTYLRDGKPLSDFTQLIDARIQELKKSSEERNYYMNYEQRIFEESEDARDEGIAIGLKQGAQSKAVETAKMFLAEGDSVEKVARCTGLPLSEVEKLK